jgi:hypothetical protein
MVVLMRLPRVEPLAYFKHSHSGMIAYGGDTMVVNLSGQRLPQPLPNLLDSAQKNIVD